MYRAYRNILFKSAFAYARIRARKEKLLIDKIKELKDKEYAELIDFLYKYGYLRGLQPEDIDKIERIELLLWRNIEYEIYLLRAISPKNSVYLIDIFVEKINVYNIKNFLRLKYSKRKELVNFFIPNPYLPYEEIVSLSKFEDIDKIIKSIEVKLIELKEYEKYIKEEIKDFDTLLKLESELDWIFLKRFYKLSKLERVGKVLIDRFNIINKLVGVNVFIEGGFLDQDELPLYLPWKEEPAVKYYPFLENCKNILELDEKFDEILLEVVKDGFYKPWFTVYPFISYILLKELEIKLLNRLIIEKYYEIRR